MMKKTILSLALALSAPLAAAQAQLPTGVFGGDDTYDCALNDLNYTAIACSGFWVGNYNNRSPGDPLSDEQTDGLGALEGYGPFANLAKKDQTGTPIMFSDLFGTTVVGFHWGNFGESAFPAGNVTAFYVFDFATSGSGEYTFEYRDGGFGGVSNAIVYRTGECESECGPPDNVVPEPSTYALMSAGLAALGFVARRRKQRV